MINNWKIFEHLTFKSDTGLKEVFEKLREKVKLSHVEYDYENETEWYRAFDDDSIEVNISKPYKTDTLHKWDSSVPLGYTFGVSLSSSKADFDYNKKIYDEDFVLKQLIPKYIKIFQSIVGSEVLYHRGKHHKTS